MSQGRLINTTKHVLPASYTKQASRYWQTFDLHVASVFSKVKYRSETACATHHAQTFSSSPQKYI